MVSSQFHYTKRNRFMPFLLAEILNFQGSTHHIGVGSFSNLLTKIYVFMYLKDIIRVQRCDVKKINDLKIIHF